MKWRTDRQQTVQEKWRNGGRKEEKKEGRQEENISVLLFCTETTAVKTTIFPLKPSGQINWLKLVKWCTSLLGSVFSVLHLSNSLPNILPVNQWILPAVWLSLESSFVLCPSLYFCCLERILCILTEEDRKRKERRQKNGISFGASSQYFLWANVTFCILYLPVRFLTMVYSGQVPVHKFLGWGSSDSVVFCFAARWAQSYKFTLCLKINFKQDLE